MKMPLLAQLLEKLRRCTSGHALILFAGGLPALIGGAGFATDLAQWYMWKRELQFAVDQAALAGAWARTSTSTQPVYAARALQEFNANLGVTRAYASSPSVTLEPTKFGNEKKSFSVSGTPTMTVVSVTSSITCDTTRAARW